jgi:hypothetical protein
MHFVYLQVNMYRNGGGLLRPPVALDAHQNCPALVLMYFAYLQVNMYQNGGRPAAASYKAYLSSDAAAGRADGYGLREWRHDPSGALWSVSAIPL